MKIIFLDIDGVITPYTSIWHPNPEHDIIHNSLVLDSKRLDMLATFCREQDAVCVITSTWRKFDDAMSFLIEEFSKRDISVIGETEITRMNARGIEIQDWLRANLTKNDTFVILDDEIDDMSEELLPYCVKPYWKDGISPEDFVRAAEILNKNFDHKQHLRKPDEKKGWENWN